MNPPTGMFTSDGNAEVIGQLRDWWKTHRRGRVFDSNGGFYLPDGSMLSPDAAYATPERLAALTPADRRGFPHLCPSFIVELLSESESLTEARQKMERWIENGVELAWLLNPYRQQVHVYGPESPEKITTATTLDGTGPVAEWTMDLAEVWRCYKP